MNQMTATLKSNRGSVLTVTLILSLMVTAFCAVVGIWISRFQASMSDHDVKTSALGIITQVEASIDNDSSWLSTLRANVKNNTSPAMNCLLKKGSVCPSGKQNFSLWLADEKVLLSSGATVTGPLVDSSKPDSGFDLSQDLCLGYAPNAKPGQGSDQCPFHIQLQWEADCGAGPCPATVVDANSGFASTPKVKISATLSYKPGARLKSVTLDAARFSIDMVRNGMNGSLSDQCGIFGGTLIQSTGYCKIPSYEKLLKVGACAADEFLYDPSTAHNCATKPTFAPGTCPSGSAVVGVFHNGELLCGKF